MDRVLYVNSMIEPKGGVFNASVIFTIVLFIAVIILLLVLGIGLVSSIKNTVLTLTNKELIIKSMIYGRRIPIENILLNEIKTLDLNENPEYHVSRRTNGMSLPNISLGWVRLKNRQKALVFLTDKSNVVLIPTKDYVILFSMTNAGEFISKIRR